MRQIRISALLPSLLLTLASVYFLYVRASFIIAPGEIIRPLIFLWLVLILLFLPAYWVTRNWDWAGLILIILVLCFFSSPLFAFSYSVIVAIILMLMWVIYRYLFKRKLAFKYVFLVLNIVSLIAIIWPLTIFVQRMETIPSSYYKNTRDVIDSKNFVELNQNSRTKPDVYFIILDGYGRADILQELYGFDNSELIEYLEQKGFVVPKSSRSNYPKTVLSVTSTLNMDYIESFAPQLDDSIMWWLMSPWLDHNRVRTSLERIGYGSVSISTDWSITDNPTTDYYFKSHPIILSDFERYFLGVTPSEIFQPLLERFASAPTYDAHRRSMMNNFISLEKITAIPGPKLVFAHIILPHPPFVFLSDGSPIDPRYAFSFNDASDYPESPRKYRDEYVGQAKFLNQQIKPVIESILQNSEEPPIIILQADHGPGMLTDFASAANTCLAERFSTFSAYYLPGMDPEKIPDDNTPVNLFRIIFNNYFDASLPMLSNDQFYPREAVGLYNLENVTSRVDEGANCSVK